MSSLPLYRRKKKPEQPEARLQKTICQHLKMTTVPGVLYFHVPNQGKRTAQYTTWLKSLGMRPGVADLVLCRDGRAYFLEVKAKGGKPEESQLAFSADALLAGCDYACVDNIDDALVILSRWGLIRQQQVRRAA